MVSRPRRPLRLALVALLACAAALLLWLWLRPAAGVNERLPRSGSSSPAEAAAPPARLPLRLAPTAGAGPAGAVAGPAAFEGRVVSAATREGIAGAELTFSRGGAASSVRSGPGGAFRFEPPATGPWLLAAVTAPGHLPFAPEWGHSPVQLTAEAGRVVRGIEVHLAPAVLLQGRVVDPDGAPVPDAEVRLLGAAAEAALVSIPDRWTSGADGAFQAAAPERAVFLARKAGYSPGLTEVSALALAQGRITITLGEGTSGPRARGALEGRVVAAGGGAAEGAPIAGALVAATPAHAWGLGDVPVAQTTTGADGRFRFADLSVGTYRLEARAEGRAPGRARGVAGGTDEAVIALEGGGRLRGCVRDASSGAPVAPFTVMVFTRRSALRLDLQRALSVIDPSGCYALSDLAPGAAVVVFSAPGRAASAPLPAEVPAPPAEAVLDAALQRGGRATGLVRDDATGAPLAGARISVDGALAAAATTFPVLAEAVSGPDGAFALDGLPARSALQVAADGHHGRIVSGVEVAPGGEVGPLEVRLRPVKPGEEARWDLAGIGISTMAGEEALVVTQVMEGGGAAQVGLEPGDQILEVDGRPVAELGFAGAVNAIRGPEGTTVVLRIRRDDGEREVTVPRRLVRG